MEKFIEKEAWRNAPHLVSIVGFVDNWDMQTYTVYMPWCSGGTLCGARKRFNSRELRRILVGACHGLAYLNTKLDLLHYDIKVGNIFVHMDESGRPSGVIGDIDDVIVRSTCEKDRTLQIMGTSCYGAPFRHCDMRRDQVALILCIADVLSDQGWWSFCKENVEQYERWKLIGYENVPPVGGGRPGDDTRMWPVYAKYVQRIKDACPVQAATDVALRIRERFPLCTPTGNPISVPDHATVPEAAGTRISGG